MYTQEAVWRTLKEFEKRQPLVYKTTDDIRCPFGHKLVVAGGERGDCWNCDGCGLDFTGEEPLANPSRKRLLMILGEDAWRRYLCNDSSCLYDVCGVCYLSKTQLQMMDCLDKSVCPKGDDLPV